MEHFFKTAAFGPTISAIPPRAYANRFLKFIDEMIDTSTN